MRSRIAAALLLAGCAFGSHRDAGRHGNPDTALARLDEAEAAAARDPSLLARAGWLRYLIASDPRGAALKLTAAEAKRFWPVYDNYQRILDSANQRRVVAVEALVTLDKPISDLYFGDRFAHRRHL